MIKAEKDGGGCVSNKPWLVFCIASLCGYYSTRGLTNYLARVASLIQCAGYWWQGLRHQSVVLRKTSMASCKPQSGKRSIQSIREHVKSGVNKQGSLERGLEHATRFYWRVPRPVNSYLRSGGCRIALVTNSKRLRCGLAGGGVGCDHGKITGRAGDGD